MTKGIHDERSLVNRLWKSGFAVIRSPASGSSTKMPRPDIIAGNSLKDVQYAIEVKTTHQKTLYIPNESISQLVEFAQLFGCQPIVALRFKSNVKSWIFIQPEQLVQTPTLNYKITMHEAKRRGIDFKTLIREGM